MVMRFKNRVVVKDNRIISQPRTGAKGGKSLASAADTRGMETAFMFGGGMQTSKNSLSVSAIGTGSSRNLDTILSGFIDEKNENQLRTFYRDIYYYDPICGGAADMTSTLPFSDFSLVGLDQKKLNVFMDSVDQLNLKTAFPSFSLGYLVDNTYLGTLVYDTSKKVFTDLLPHDVMNCTFEEMPFASQDPLIIVKQSEELRNFLESEEEVIRKQRKNYSSKLLAALSEPEFTLDPLTTIYLPRLGVNGERVSYFRRVLPWYLLEKTLLRGTLVEAQKRQRSALHVQAGSETWEPTPEELQTLVTLFQQADFDPLGPTIATRNDIQIAEIRQGGDFWKITDIVNETNAQKLRALSISETFLSGEATYSTAETSLSVYIENMRAYRDYLTQQTFYRRMFPTIAHVNGFTKTRKEETAGPSLGMNINNSTRYEIPQVRWHKSLHPHSDRDTLEILNQLSEKGIPITLRMYAAAGGMDIEALMNELDEDKKMREKIASLTGKPEQEGPEEEDYSLASLLNPIKKVGFTRRNYGDLAEPVERTVTGKRKFVYRPHQKDKQNNEIIAKALKNLSDQNHYAGVKKKIQARLNRNRG